MTPGTRTVEEHFNARAPAYDARTLPFEWFGLRHLRRRLLSRAEGRVLEVGVGTGKNLPLYPEGTDLLAVDLSRAMLGRARRKGRASGRRIPLAAMDVETLALRSASFDTVVDTLGVCSYPDPAGALREIFRVCRPGGRALLLEHGRSDRGWLARLQVVRDRWKEPDPGCRWSRRPGALARGVGFRVIRSHRRLLGVVRLLELRRPADGGPGNRRRDDRRGSWARSGRTAGERGGPSDRRPGARGEAP